MVAYCESCDYQGSETYIGDMSLEECEAACLGDTDCYAIDWGQSNFKCYLNYNAAVGAGDHTVYSAWIKECSNRLIRWSYILGNVFCVYTFRLGFRNVITG